MLDAMALRVLFADDEPTARKRMRRLLETIADVQVVAECTSGEDALRELDRIDVDVAVLDVRMGAVSGLDVATMADELGVEVVFTTAHDAHAVDAFARGAVDYVLKPVEEQRLAIAIERVRERVAKTRGPRSDRALDRIALTVRGEVRLLDRSEITHAVLDGELVRVFTTKESVLTERTLAELSEMLGAGFERVHRRALIDLAHVARLRPLATGGYTAITNGGHEVPISRQAARAIRRRLGIG
jgi:two-component system LytT family response regulator